MRITICIILLSMAAISSSAQTMAQRALAAKTPVNLQCVRASSGGSNRVTWRTSYGSSAREISRTATYTCRVRWSGRAATNAVLDVWFVGVPGEGGGKEIILDNKVVHVDLLPSSTVSVDVTSEEVGNDKATYVALGMKDVSGAQLRGCVVQLIMGDAVVRTYSSQSHLAAAAWKDPFGSISSGTIGQ